MPRPQQPPARALALALFPACLAWGGIAALAQSPGDPAALLETAPLPVAWDQRDRVPHAGFPGFAASVRVTPRTGLVTGSPRDAGAGLNLTFTGVVFQKQGRVAGAYLGARGGSGPGAILPR